MAENKYFEDLGKPFPYSDVQWRMQYVDEQQGAGFAVPYLDARAIADRFDAVLGQNRWKDEYVPWHNYIEKTERKGEVITKQINSQICKISVYDEERKEWISKCDAAENTDFEPIKGGITDAFKRAAVKWNVGRYMYRMNAVWVSAKKKGKNYVVNDEDERTMRLLENEYNRVVAEVFGTNAITSAPKKPTNSSAGQPNPQVNPNNQNTSAADIYEIKDVAVQSNGNQTQSRLVISKNGCNSTVFMMGSDNQFKAGTKLSDLIVQQRQIGSGNYTILESYKIAA